MKTNGRLDARRWRERVRQACAALPFSEVRRGDDVGEPAREQDKEQRRDVDTDARP